ncbi:hypothetical protein BH11PSE7_BH11PSE7_18920 [soil metagenome]
MANIRIGFTACSKINFDADQPVWAEMAAQKPDHLLLLGDQIYMDYWRDSAKGMPAVGLKGYELDAPASLPLDEFKAQMRLRYRLQFEVASFQALIRQVGVAGTVSMIWDDHDFGFNNSYGMAGTATGGVIPADKKAVSRSLFEEFRLNVEKLRTTPGPLAYQALDPVLPRDASVYSALTLGSARVLMLDTRTFRQPPAADHPQLLGQAQWDELEKEVRNSPQKLIVICSGSPFTEEATLSDQSWKQGKYSKFSTYVDYDRLVQLAAQVNRRIVFIGGDSHKVDLHTGTPGLVEIVCAGAAAPKGPLFMNGRHFGLLDVDDAGHAQTRLFKRGKVQIEQALFGQGVAGALEAMPEVAVPAGQPGWQARVPPVATAFMLSARRGIYPTGEGANGLTGFADAYEPMTFWITQARPGQWRNVASWKAVTQADFTATLLQHLEQSGDMGEGGQLCFYAHGALHNWFETAGKFADVINTQIFVPRKLGVPVFVSWASIKDVQILTNLQSVYNDSVSNARRAGEDLGDYLSVLLSQLPHEGVQAGQLPLTMLSSSVGNQLLGSALKRLHGLPSPAPLSGVFRRWTMLAADLDSTLFAQSSPDIALARAIADLCLEAVATWTPQDEVLRRVQEFNAGLARVGQAGFVDVLPEFASWAHAVNVDRIVQGLAHMHSAMLETPQGVALTTDALGNMPVLQLQQKYS